MKWDELERIADEGTIKATELDKMGITTVSFRVNGSSIKAQTDTDNPGLYAFMIEDPLEFFNMIAALRDSAPMETS